ncbi:MAG: response regulator [Pseudomonadota bacterium]
MADILVLEDDPETAFDLRTLLEDHGHDVRWLRGASAALASLEETPADLVIADIYIYRDGRVTQDGGISLIAAMRMSRGYNGTPRLDEIPVIAISGAGKHPGNKHILDVAMSVGAKHSLPKPVDHKALLSLTADLLPIGQDRQTAH